MRPGSGPGRTPRLIPRQDVPGSPGPVWADGKVAKARADGQWLRHLSPGVAQTGWGPGMSTVTTTQGHGAAHLQGGPAPHAPGLRWGPSSSLQQSSCRPAEGAWAPALEPPTPPGEHTGRRALSGSHGWGRVWGEQWPGGEPGGSSRWAGLGGAGGGPGLPGSGLGLLGACPLPGRRSSPAPAPAPGLPGQPPWPVRGSGRQRGDEEARSLGEGPRGWGGGRSCLCHRPGPDTSHEPPRMWAVGGRAVHGQSCGRGLFLPPGRSWEMQARGPSSGRSPPPQTCVPEGEAEAGCLLHTPAPGSQTPGARPRPCPWPGHFLSEPAQLRGDRNGAHLLAPGLGGLRAGAASHPPAHPAVLL